MTESEQILAELKQLRGHIDPSKYRAIVGMNLVLAAIAALMLYRTWRLDTDFREFVYEDAARWQGNHRVNPPIYGAWDILEMVQTTVLNNDHDIERFIEKHDPAFVRAKSKQAEELKQDVDRRGSGR